MSDRSRVLIVVPCLNEASNLPRLLHQLIDENPRATIIVVDGGSRDESRAIVEGFRGASETVYLLDNPRRIQSAGVNLAVARFGAMHDWLVRVDAHCRYPADFVGRLLDAALRQEATSVVVPMVTHGETCFQRAAAAAQNSVLGTGGSAHRRLGEGRFVDHGHHALFSLPAFVAAGGYDENFSHNEDAELDARLGARGARIWLEPNAALVYWPRRSPAALFRQYRNYGSGRARTVAKHGMRLKLRQQLPIMVAPAVSVAAIGICLMPLATGLSALTVPALFWVVLCLGCGVLLGLKAGSACATLAGPAAMVMHLGWSLGYWQMRWAIATRTVVP